MSGASSDGVNGARYWWIQQLRGVFILGMGISLIGSLMGFSVLETNYASKEQVLLFVGMFWLTTGLMSLIWGTKVAKDPKHWWILAAIVGIGGGIFVILRTTIDDYIGIYAAKNVIALFFLMNGAMNILDFHKNPEDSPRWKMRKSPARLSFFMGIVEIVIAVTLAFFWEVSVFIDTFITTLAIIWSMISGVGLFYRGYRLKKLWRTRFRITINPGMCGTWEVFAKNIEFHKDESQLVIEFDTEWENGQINSNSRYPVLLPVKKRIGDIILDLVLKGQYPQVAEVGLSYKGENDVFWSGEKMNGKRVIGVTP